ncbi:MAG: imidazoleglycerol-phosphate dehydratase HisB [candidate division NC10 bacterium]|nr:imidazoleglycerol-phosphate dehydratase HisB [candidate division NC10 bacterium]
MGRRGRVERRTAETAVTVELEIEGKGDYQIQTGIPFLNHMLSLFAKHGLFDLKIQAQGDVEVDLHHTVEDVGIALGEVFEKALGEKVGIKRYGSALVPMEEALATVSVDLSGRPYLVYKVPSLSGRVKDFDLELGKEFFKAFANQARCNLHLELRYGEDLHHSLEALFKAFGKALDEATALDERVKDVPSTKGKL